MSPRVAEAPTSGASARARAARMSFARVGGLGPRPIHQEATA